MISGIPRALQVLSALALVVAFGVRSAAGPAPARAASSPYHGTIIIDFKTDISHLDTGRCYDTECYPFMKVMYDRLVDYNTAAGLNDPIVPDAAVAMPKITNGGKTFIFRLRHNVRFWDGHLATSADWKYSFERILNPKTEAGASSFWLNIVGAKAFAAGKAKHVSGIQTAGPWGLKINLVSPDASFLNVLSMPFGSVVDKSWIAKYGRSYDSQHPMGTGPYMFKQHVLGQKLILVPNPHYFGGHVGHAAEIEADFGVDTNTGFLRIQRGQADLDGDEPAIPAPDFLNTLHDPKWGKQVTKLVQVATWYISMNTQMKYFNNVLVRRAVNMAINRPLLTRLIQGRAVPTTTMLPPGMPGHGNFNLYPYNLAKAKQLMAKAGYPHGFDTTFYTDDVADDPRISQAIVPMLANIGIKATLRIVNGNTWQTLVGTKGKVPITWSQWYMDFPDPNDFFEPILSCASAVPGTFNESWYCDPNVDRYAHQLKSMLNRTQRLKLYPKLDRMMMEDAPIVPVMNPVFYDIHSLALHNYRQDPVWGYVFENYIKS